MPRTARQIVPDMPHHIVQRGNRRQDVFFEAEDFRYYLFLLRKQANHGDFSVHGYCLMPNHIHLIVTPHKETGLRGIGEVHRLYTRYINKKKGWQGYLWQGRFNSYPMDSAYCYDALRYVELNPVAAGICAHPAEYRWSSAKQRLGKSADYGVAPCPHLAVTDWETYWQEGIARKQAMQEFLDSGTQ